MLLMSHLVSQRNIEKYTAAQGERGKIAHNPRLLEQQGLHPLKRQCVLSLGLDVIMFSLSVIALSPFGV